MRRLVLSILTSWPYMLRYPSTKRDTSSPMSTRTARSKTCWKSLGLSMSHLVRGTWSRSLWDCSICTITGEVIIDWLSRPYCTIKMESCSSTQSDLPPLSPQETIWQTAKTFTTLRLSFCSPKDFQDLWKTMSGPWDVWPFWCWHQLAWPAHHSILTTSSNSEILHKRGWSTT